MSGVLTVPNTGRTTGLMTQIVPGGGEQKAGDPNCSEGGAVELMTQTAPWGNKRADDPVVPRTGEQKG